MFAPVMGGRVPQRNTQLLRHPPTNQSRHSSHPATRPLTFLPSSANLFSVYACSPLRYYAFQVSSLFSQDVF